MCSGEGTGKMAQQNKLTYAILEQPNISLAQSLLLPWPLERSTRRLVVRLWHRIKVRPHVSVVQAVKVEERDHVKRRVQVLGRQGWA